eukprot:scaffold13618_cov66-Phaeocystis_antarctica.AAC.5
MYTCKTYHDHKTFVYALLYTLYGLRLYPQGVSTMPWRKCRLLHAAVTEVGHRLFPHGVGTTLEQEALILRVACARDDCDGWLVGGLLVLANRLDDVRSSKSRRLRAVGLVKQEQFEGARLASLRLEGLQGLLSRRGLDDFPSFAAVSCERQPNELPVGADGARRRSLIGRFDRPHREVEGKLTPEPEPEIPTPAHALVSVAYFADLILAHARPGVPYRDLNFYGAALVTFRCVAALDDAAAQLHIALQREA